MTARPGTHALGWVGHALRTSLVDEAAIKIVPNQTCTGISDNPDIEPGVSVQVWLILVDAQPNLYAKASCLNHDALRNGEWLARAPVTAGLRGLAPLRLKP